jgi:hypothetical protein
MSQDDVIRKELINPDKALGQDAIFEQYKLYLEMADRISSRRSTANSFFLGINTAVVSLLGIVKSIQEPGAALTFYSFAAPTGMILSIMWYVLVKSYRDLGTAKFKVVHQIERFLPLRPYHAEWAAVGHGKNPKLYRPFTQIEASVPWVFFAIYLGTLLYRIPWCRLRF